VAVQTTFSMFQELLKESVAANSSLDSVMQAALRSRVDALPRLERLELGARNVDGSTGVTVSEPNDVITVPDGASGTVDWDLATFSTPVRISGGDGPCGALVGGIGQGSNPPVAVDDITLKYRLSSGGSWLAFGPTVTIPSATSVQFRAEIATQTGDHDLPHLHLVAEQL